MNESYVAPTVPPPAYTPQSYVELRDFSVQVDDSELMEVPIRNMETRPGYDPATKKSMIAPCICILIIFLMLGALLHSTRRTTHNVRVT